MYGLVYPACPRGACTSRSLKISTAVQKKNSTVVCDDLFALALDFMGVMTLQISHLAPIFTITMTRNFTFMALFPRNARRISLQPTVLSPPAELFLARTLLLFLSCDEGSSPRICLSLSREEG